MERKIFVYADWIGLNKPQLMGTLNSSLIRGKEIFSFEYSEEWINSGILINIDPDLKLYKGHQYLSDKKPNFGIFLDSAPDRWGRKLMQRREAIIARDEERKEKTHTESDFLLGVFDEHRMGAIRFKNELDGPFLDNNKNFASPPWTSLRELEQASLHIEQEKFSNKSEYLKWFYMLLAPGSSLGGARPKAGVIDNNKNLWIAKFPSSKDDIDIGAWAMVVNDLALKSGINVADSKLLKLSSKYHTFISKRFDRTSRIKRIHFASAMTMLGLSDSDEEKHNASYLNIAEFISTNGANVNQDLEELWKRIIFNICVSNTDDHLRNHGFLLTNKGWKLSPAYDINPTINSPGLSLNISETDNSLELDLAISVKNYFRISDKKSSEIIKTVLNSVKNWKLLAKKYKISNNEQEQMSKAFRIK